MQEESKVIGLSFRANTNSIISQDTRTSFVWKGSERPTQKKDDSRWMLTFLSNFGIRPASLKGESKMIALAPVLNWYSFYWPERMKSKNNLGSIWTNNINGWKKCHKVLWCANILQFSLIKKKENIYTRKMADYLKKLY